MKIAYIITGLIIAMGAVAMPIKNAAASIGIEADQPVIPVGSTNTLKLWTGGGVTLAIPDDDWFKVKEPDGDRCDLDEAKFTFPITVAGAFSVVYPDDFDISTAKDDPLTGDNRCDTMNIGEYEVDVDARANAGTINTKIDFDVSFFVLPESPIGAIALIVAPIAAVSTYLLRKKNITS